MPLREETSALRTKPQTYPPAQVQMLQQIFGWLAVVAAAVADRATGRSYNVGEADTLTELEWAQQVAQALNWDGEFN